MNDTILTEETLNRLFDDTITDEEYKAIRSAIKAELDRKKKRGGVVYSKKAIYEIYNDPFSSRMNIHYIKQPDCKLQEL